MVNNRKSLDPRWVTHHTGVVAGFHNCVVTITRRTQGTDPVYDPDTKTYSNVGTVVYTGPARVQPYGINLDLEVANDPTARRLVLVQVEGKNLGLRTDDVLSVDSVTDNNNNDLIEYRYDIRGSIGSSLEWGTNLVCEANLKKGAV